MRRFTKQIAIVAGLAVLLLGAAGVFWFTTFYETPSCEDNIQNQNEVGVDCGGVCEACIPEPEEVPEPEAQGASFVIGEDNTFDTFFFLENPNVHFGAKRLSYTVRLEGRDGEVLAERQGETFLQPLETRPIVENSLDTGGVTPGRVAVAIGEITWVAVPEDTPDDELVLVQPVFRRLPQDRDVAEITGIVLNNSPFTYDRIDINVLVYDASGLVVAARNTAMRTLSSGERRAFRVAWRTPLFIEGEPRLEIDVATNVFENENFVRTHGTIERFQQLR